MSTLPLKWWAILVNYADVCSFLLQRSLATDLQNLSMELRKKQSTYLKRLRQQKEVQNKYSFSTIQWAQIFRLDFAIYRLCNSSSHLLELERHSSIILSKTASLNAASFRLIISWTDLFLYL